MWTPAFEFPRIQTYDDEWARNQSALDILGHLRRRPSWNGKMLPSGSTDEASRCPTWRGSLVPRSQLPGWQAGSMCSFTITKSKCQVSIWSQRCLTLNHGDGPRMVPQSKARVNNYLIWNSRHPAQGINISGTEWLLRILISVLDHSKLGKFTCVPKKATLKH